MSKKTNARAALAPDSVWVVIDEQGSPHHVTTSKQWAHDHINDAIQEHNLAEAAHWTVREYTVATPKD